MIAIFKCHPFGAAAHSKNSEKKKSAESFSFWRSFFLLDCLTEIHNRHLWDAVEDSPSDSFYAIVVNFLRHYDAKWKQTKSTASRWHFNNLIMKMGSGRGRLASTRGQSLCREGNLMEPLQFEFRINFLVVSESRKTNCQWNGHSTIDRSDTCV